MIVIPPYLKKNDTIAIVCPSGYMPYENAVICIKTLQEWGLKVKVGNTLGNQFHYFSGTDEERLTDFQQMLDDDSVQAILCGRGGYGLTRIIDKINFKKFAKKPKWIIGFSDVTVLHAHINQRIKIATLHAPMVNAFNDGGFEQPSILTMKKALQGKPINYKTAIHSLNRNGKAVGSLIGGNLAIIAHLIGTTSSYQTKNKILFVEDVGEYIYNVDRMFLQLKRNGMLKHLAALIIGGFSEMKDTTIPFGEEVYAIIKQHVEEYNYPVCFNFPVSHEKTNMALKIGVQHQLTVTNKQVQLKEIN